MKKQHAHQYREKQRSDHQKTDLRLRASQNITLSELPKTLLHAGFSGFLAQRAAKAVFLSLNLMPRKLQQRKINLVRKQKEKRSFLDFYKQKYELLSEGAAVLVLFVILSQSFVELTDLLEFSLLSIDLIRRLSIVFLRK